MNNKLIASSSYESISHDYAEANQWMKDIGVKMSSGRTTHYTKVIDF